MTLTTVEYVRTTDGAERVQIGLAEFQALLDAASVAERGLPAVATLIAELREALTSTEGYIDAGDLLARYDATHRPG